VLPGFAPVLESEEWLSGHKRAPVADVDREVHRRQGFSSLVGDRLLRTRPDVFLVTGKYAELGITGRKVSARMHAGLLFFLHLSCGTGFFRLGR
jgi:hypothetical protein